MPNRKMFVMQELRHALELFVQTINDESVMMEVADVYPAYEVGKAYKTGDVFRYGVNGDGETQLYSVLLDHTSASEWLPNEASSLYKAVGVTDDGVAIWTQPLGATDAYMTGDVVEFDGQRYVSTVDNNIWSPTVYGWEIVNN